MTQPRHNQAAPPSWKEFAGALGCSKGYITSLWGLGMPKGSIADAKAWWANKQLDQKGNLFFFIIIIIINPPSDPDRARKRPQSKRSQSPETAINPSATPSALSATASAAAAAERRPDAPGFLGNPDTWPAHILNRAGFWEEVTRWAHKNSTASIKRRDGVEIHSWKDLEDMGFKVRACASVSST